MNIKIFFLFFLLLIPFSLAFNCEDLEGINREYCYAIKNSDLNETEQNMLIAQLIHNRTEFPNHQSIYDWNIKINTSSPPDGITAVDEGYIKNAWMVILTVMPSILQQGKLYNPGYGELLSAYDHDVEIPTETMPGDCRTEYFLRENTGILSVFLNGILQGYGRLVSFFTEQNMLFKAVYEITVRTDIDHYKWHQYCCGRGKRGRCVRWCQECRFSHTEEKIDYLELTDWLYANSYRLDLFGEFEIYDQYFDNSKAVLKTKNFTFLNLSFKDSSFAQNNFLYGVNYSFIPYYVLTIEPIPFTQYTVHNLNMANNATPYDITVKNLNQCKITLHDHFRQESFVCNLEYKDIKLNIETDKVSYYEGNDILVSIEPRNTLVNLTYAGKSYLVKDSMVLKAVYPYNKIRISYARKSFDKIIVVKERENWMLFLQLLLALGIIVLLTIIITKTWGKAVGRM